MLTLGITEGPDPIPQIIWDPVRDVDAAWFLNPDGGTRGDGRPDVAFDSDGIPHVVWAYNNGIDFDIAYSTWTGSGWLAPQFLTSSLDDEIDPRIFIDDSTIYVVWWTADPDTIYLSTQPLSGVGWSQNEQVGASSEAGLRPSIVVVGGTYFVGAEIASESGNEIVISTRQGQDEFVVEVVMAAAQDDPINVVLHAEQGKLWMDWRNSPTMFAYSEFVQGAWTPPTAIPWTDDSWVKLEEIRLIIRSTVLSD